VLFMCCIVLRCVAVCYSVLQCVAGRCSVLQCVAVCCRALQYVQGVAVCDENTEGSLDKAQCFSTTQQPYMLGKRCIVHAFIHTHTHIHTHHKEAIHIVNMRVETARHLQGGVEIFAAVSVKSGYSEF